MVCVRHGFVINNLLTNHLSLSPLQQETVRGGLPHGMLLTKEFQNSCHGGQREELNPLENKTKELNPPGVHTIKELNPPALENFRKPNKNEPQSAGNKTMGKEEFSSPAASETL
jgi:hypothetical protein